MNPIHTKAAYWLQKGLFDDLKSFADFESRVNVVFEEKDRGDLFEIFIEGYIATQAITQRVKHWVVGNIPLEMRERYNLPSDGTGIDGIYETHDGSHVAYQVKRWLETLIKHGFIRKKLLFVPPFIPPI